MLEYEPTLGESLYGDRAADPAPAAAARAAAAPADPAAAPSKLPKRPAGIPKMERRTVPDNDDIATAETVRMMCDYIGAGVGDELCQAWAKYAQSCYAVGPFSTAADPRSNMWAVFWLLKHSVKYRRDEPELFRIGQGDARDLLTAPAVLVRQPQPAEDCDGFTMLACTLLRILGLDCYVVTVKADPSEPTRWSHVFALVDVPGKGSYAVDASHGKFPGWMIPREHIFGYQVWDLNGRPVQKPLPSSVRLNGYVQRGRGMGRRGMGDTTGLIDPTTGDTLANIGVDQYGNMVDPTTGVPIGGTTPTMGPSAGSPGFNWTSFVNNLIGTAGKVATVAEAPAGSVVTPQGAVYMPGSSPLSTMTFGSLLPWLAIGAVVIIGMSAASKGK